MNEETRFLLQQAVSEIRSLRRSNEIMGAQLEVVEVFRAALMGPRQPQGMTQDFTFAIEKLLAANPAN